MQPVARALMIAGIGLLMTGPAVAQDQGVSLRARLSGFQEIITAGGAVSTRATGLFTGRIAPDGSRIDYTLSFQFPSTTPTAGAQYVNQAHLHFGQRGTTGNIVAWLCESPDNASPKASTPACPSPSGEVSGTLTNDDLIEVPGQLFENKPELTALERLIDGLRNGAVYANVHTDASPQGEIRGQVNARGD